MDDQTKETHSNQLSTELSEMDCIFNFCLSSNEYNQQFLSTKPRHIKIRTLLSTQNSIEKYTSKKINTHIKSEEKEINNLPIQLNNAIPNRKNANFRRHTKECTSELKSKKSDSPKIFDLRRFLPPPSPPLKFISSRIEGKKTTTNKNKNVQSSLFTYFFSEISPSEKSDSSNEKEKDDEFYEMLVKLIESLHRRR